MHYIWKLLLCKSLHVEIILRLVSLYTCWAKQRRRTIVNVFRCDETRASTFMLFLFVLPLKPMVRWCECVIILSSLCVVNALMFFSFAECFPFVHHFSDMMCDAVSFSFPMCKCNIPWRGHILLAAFTLNIHSVVSEDVSEHIYKHTGIRTSLYSRIFAHTCTRESSSVSR